MKHLFALITAFIVCISTYGQNLQEVVYLKNGSVIKGTIIEQVPNESLTIKTADGSTFVWKMSEISKITKEAVKPTRTYSYAANDDDDEEEEEEKEYDTEGYRPRGYMGFVEEASITDFDDFFGAVHTTHGFQINSHIFVGGGAGFIFPYSGDAFAVPVYGAFRYTLLNKKVTPYFEAKCGYCFADIEGFYASPSVGVDIAFTQKFGLYIGLAYELYSSAKNVPYVSLYDRYGYHYETKNESLNTMALHVGIHF